MEPRLEGAMIDHFFKAFAATSIARRISATVPLGTESTISPVAGLRTGVVSLLSESTNSLATNNFAIESSVWFQNFKNNHVHRWLSRIGDETGMEIDESTSTEAQLGKSWASVIKSKWSKCLVRFVRQEPTAS